MAPEDVRSMLSLVAAGWILVSSARCSLEEIALAKAERRFFVDEHGLGYVVRTRAAMPIESSQGTP